MIIMSAVKEIQQGRDKALDRELLLQSEYMKMDA